MDNLAHGLAGAALGEAGLKRITGLGMVTLIIAANLPDVDALGLLVGENLAWRRGWTHGPLGLLLLPPLLALAMLGFDRWQARRGTRPAGRPEVRLGGLLALAYIGALSHPALDLLNTYGVRLLMPFSERWFYGDTLFIIDVWLWTMLAAGVWIARRRGSARPARVSLGLAALYIGLMGAGSHHAAEETRAAVAARGLPVEEVVASPVPIDPFRRRIAYSTGTAYGFGDYRWGPAGGLALEPGLVPRNMDDPAIARAAEASKPVRDFLYWSRLPFARITRDDEGVTVWISDARYSDLPTSGTFTRTVRLPPEPAGSAPVGALPGGAQREQADGEIERQ
jgi:inner membrane protein